MTFWNCIDKADWLYLLEHDNVSRVYHDGVLEFESGIETFSLSTRMVIEEPVEQQFQNYLHVEKKTFVPLMVQMLDFIYH